jgi:hypothetical protein
MKPRRLKKLDFSDNLRFAKRFVSQTLSPVLLEQLRELTCNSSFSLRYGDLVLLSSGWYVTHTGLIRLATRRRCRGIEVHPIPEFSDAKNGRYVFKATVFKSRTCQGFVGYGDADPSNVSLLVHGAEMRVAETRAVNRALRKAYGIGTCSIEEIGSVAEPAQPSRDSKKLPHNLLTGTAGGVQSAIASAKSFASISSILTLSKPTRPTSAVLRLCAKLQGNKLRPSSLT